MAKAKSSSLEENVYAIALVNSGSFEFSELDGMSDDDLVDLCSEMEIEVSTGKASKKAATPPAKTAKAAKAPIIEEEEEEEDEEEDEEEEPAPLKKGKTTPAPKAQPKAKAKVVVEEKEEDEDDEDEIIQKVSKGSAATTKAAKREDNSDKLDIADFKAITSLFPEADGYVYNALKKGMTVKIGGKGVISFDGVKTVNGKVVGSLYFNALKGKDECETVLGDLIEEGDLKRFSNNLWYVMGLSIKDAAAILKAIKPTLATKATKAAKAAKENMAKMREAAQATKTPVTGKATKAPVVYEAEEDEEEEEEEDIKPIKKAAPTKKKK